MIAATLEHLSCTCKPAAGCEFGYFFMKSCSGRISVSA
jgi:hypothetical protein